jgi:hypothetical protein
MDMKPTAEINDVKLSINEGFEIIVDGICWRSCISPNGGIVVFGKAADSGEDKSEPMLNSNKQNPETF